jgi:membrane peptidoglycan carboxypeptidase
MSDGDPNSPRQGRAQVPSPSGKSDSSGGRSPSGGAVGNGGAGASAGRARVGRAPVSGAGAGRASVGRAGVPGPDARAGRARVPASSAGSGRATVGRASVGAGSAKGARPTGADVIENRGPAQRPPKGAKSAAAAARARRARRRNWILGSFALLIMLAGGTVVAGAFFYDDVELPANLPQRQQATTIFYSDNKTQMGKIGNENRTIIPSEQIPPHVKDAVVATENKDFYTDEGISYTGIARAAWNNVTGGQRQGASTITQQYARAIADLKGITYSRKLREAMLAMKLSKTYKKDEILTAYLNTVYFGRQSYGIEAAAEAYFGKHSKDLTLAEGMALAAVIKDPAGGPGGLSVYDGTANPQAALDRFDNYIKPNLVQMKKLTPTDAAALKYPEMKKYDPTDPAFAAQWGLDRPTGNVLHNVIDELTHMTDAKGNLMFPDLEEGGYRIVTTIDKSMQEQAEKYAGGQAKDSPLANAKVVQTAGSPADDKVVAGLVSVEPYSGRVKAYYGGPNGGEQDVAGIWRDKILSKDKKDDYAGFGRHQPASSFKIYTLGAALRAGISINSYWEAPATKTYPGEAQPVRNAEQTNSCEGGGKVCRLWEATAQSLNVPFYDVTKDIGADKVLEFARDAGIRHIWNDDPQRFDLNPTGPTNAPLDAHIGFGQFRVTVVDHANGVASLAARGARAQAHFVSQVYKGSALVYKEPFKPAQIPGFSQNMADDATFALQKVLTATNPSLQLANGRAAAAKTGTWQATEKAGDTKSNGNSNAWMVGYLAPDLTKKPQFYGLATAVWMGALKGDSVPITIKGQNMFGSTGPGKIWKGYMDAVTAGMPKTKFAQPKFVGDDKRGNAQAPAAPQPPADQNGGQSCLIPLFCPPGQQGLPAPGQAGSGNGNSNGNGDRNGNGNGNGNGGQGGGSPVVPGAPAVFPSRRP